MKKQVFVQEQQLNLLRTQVKRREDRIQEQRNQGLRELIALQEQLREKTTHESMYIPTELPFITTMGENAEAEDERSAPTVDKAKIEEILAKAAEKNRTDLRKMERKYENQIKASII